MTQWCITRDFLAEQLAAPGPTGTNGNAVGLVGPRGTRPTALQISGHPEAVKFRMFDADGELYYEGFVIGDEFAPLDDFGTPNAGATTIKILVDGAWRGI